MTENEIATQIVDAAFKVHSRIGPGLLESSYKACLLYELSKRRLSFQEEYPVPLVYDEIKLDCGYRIDLLVENKVVIEIKAVSALHEVHLAQILTYLRLSERRLGFLINFNVKLIKDGIRRVVLDR